MKNKINIKQYFSDLFSSIANTPSLFKFCIYSWLTPFLIFLITLSIISVPSIVLYNQLTVEDVTDQVEYIDKAVMDVLSKNLDCSIKNNTFSCNQDYTPFLSTYSVETENGNIDYTYKVFIGSEYTSGVDFTIGTFSSPTENENYLIFFEKTFQYRYVYRNPTSKEVYYLEVHSSYEKLGDLNFAEIYNNYKNIENSEEANNYLQNQANTIILEGYKTEAFNQIYSSILSTVSIYLIFMLIVAILMKGNTMLRRKQGFTFSQALKIAFVSSLQSVLAALVLMLAGINFIGGFGLALTTRTIYIYIKYTGSKKNTQWSNDLYKLTNDERFKFNA